MYSISPFILDIVDTDGVCKLFTPTGATSITDAGLIAVLHEFSDMRPRAARSKIIDVLKRSALPVDAAEKFLVRIKILREIKSDDSVAIFCPSHDLANGLADCIQNNDAMTYRVVDDLADIDSPTFLIAIQATYTPAVVREVYAACARIPNCIMLHAYFVFRHFVIDGFYSPTMGLPDHFSGLHNLAGLDRNSDFKPISWADFFLSDPYALESLSVPTFAANKIESAAALHLLYMRLRPLLVQGIAPLFSDDLSTVIEMNLDTGRIERYRGAHSTFSPEPRFI